jgi:hypothetical protein
MWAQSSNLFNSTDKVVFCYIFPTNFLLLEVLMKVKQCFTLASVAEIEILNTVEYCCFYIFVMHKDVIVLGAVSFLG